MNYSESKTISLYIHWPFCKSKCYYCDFISFQQHESFQEIYHEALINEIINFSKKNDSKYRIKTIFIGGGTPSLYPDELLIKLFTTLQKYFDLSAIEEISMETNPQDITHEKLELWRKVGISRLSVGIQILNDKIMSSLNRKQTVEEAINASKIIPNFFENFSIDLILGLPGVCENIWDQTINTILSWKQKHISMYLSTIA